MTSPRRELLGGWSLIIAAVVGLLTTLIHPTEHELRGGHEQPEVAAQHDLVERLRSMHAPPESVSDGGPHGVMDRASVVRTPTGVLNRAVHASGVSMLVLIFVGLVGMRRFVGGGDWALVGLVVQALALIGGLTAAVAAGSVMTSLFEAMAHADGVVHRELVGHARLTYMWNQGFVQVYAMCFSLGLVAWAPSLVGHGGGLRLAGWFGAIAGAVTVVALLIGIRLDVHGFGVVFVGHAIWMAWLGTLLVRGRAQCGGSEAARGELLSNP